MYQTNIVERKYKVTGNGNTQVKHLGKYWLFEMLIPAPKIFFHSPWYPTIVTSISPEKATTVDPNSIWWLLQTFTRRVTDSFTHQKEWGFWQTWHMVDVHDWPYKNTSKGKGTTYITRQVKGFYESALYHPHADRFKSEVTDGFKFRHHKYI